MKISAADADRFAQSPDPRIRAVLVYGPDGGLVHERAGLLIRSVVEDPSDPFRVAELSTAQVLDDQARLGDEMAALSLVGGRRVVRLRDAADSLKDRLASLLEAPPGDALLVAEAGDLPPRSALRRLFEAAALAAALPCYRDADRQLSGFIVETLAQEGLKATPEAVAFLADHLGGDRQLTRRELEKLVLYKGADGGASDPIDLDDARASIGDAAAHSMDDLVFAVAEGDLAALERARERSQQEGAPAVVLLRAAAGHFQRLHVTADLVSAGTPAPEAMKRLRPPVFWKLQPRFRAQVQAWPRARLSRTLVRLLEAESACKTGGAPAEAIAARTLLEITANAPRQGRR